jgi:hypothetical protein
MLGALFVLVTIFLPKGVVGAWPTVKAKFHERFSTPKSNLEAAQ